MCNCLDVSSLAAFCIESVKFCKFGRRELGPSMLNKFEVLILQPVECQSWWKSNQPFGWMLMDFSCLSREYETNSVSNSLHPHF